MNHSPVIRFLHILSAVDMEFEGTGMYHLEGRFRELESRVVGRVVLGDTNFRGLFSGGYFAGDSDFEKDSLILFVSAGIGDGSYGVRLSINPQLGEIVGFLQSTGYLLYHRCDFGIVQLAVFILVMDTEEIHADVIIIAPQGFNRNEAFLVENERNGGFDDGMRMCPCRKRK